MIKMPVFDFDKWNTELAELAETYQIAEPFAHGVYEDFLCVEAAKSAHHKFPKITDKGWIHYLHVNEKKHGLNKLELIPNEIKAVIYELNSPAFLSWLSTLTGIDDLLPDPTFEGGGIHQTERGGYLNIHADFTVHPHNKHLRRRVNVLVYLNENWHGGWGGELELWDREMKQCVKKVSPEFNRVVIFNTDETSYHGQPEPLKCPANESRKSIALYYFTKESSPINRSTTYKARPTDGIKSIFIWLDQKVLQLYSSVKSVLGINDDFISSLLNKFGNKRKDK